MSDPGSAPEPKPSMAASIPPWGHHAPSPVARRWILLGRTTPLGKGSARRWLVARLRRLANPFDITLAGARVRLWLGDNRSEIKALVSGDRFMADEQAVFAELASEPRAQPSPGPLTVVDIGANAGLFSALAAVHLPQDSAILAIEPHPALQDRLKANLSFAPTPARIRQVAVAVGASDSTLSLTYRPGDLGGSSLAQGQVTGEAVTASVPVRPLLAVILEAGLDRIDLLKIDVEGFEDQALCPFFAAAPASLWPRMVLMEVVHAARWQSPLIDQMLAAGYVVARRRGPDITLRRVGEGRWPG